jgi:hypothetical protein
MVIPFLSSSDLWGTTGTVPSPTLGPSWSAIRFVPLTNAWIQSQWTWTAAQGHTLSLTLSTDYRREAKSISQVRDITSFIQYHQNPLIWVNLQDYSKQPTLLPYVLLCSSPNYHLSSHCHKCHTCITVTTFSLSAVRSQCSALDFVVIITN